MRISLDQTCKLLLEGEVVAVPTETVYGLAASLKHPKAIAKIYSLKGRPSNNPLIVHLANAQEIYPYVKAVPPSFSELASHFWPGPLTLVLEVLPNAIPEVVSAGLPTTAFRVPTHALTEQLLEVTGPLVMPSANLSGKPSATSAEHVEQDFGIECKVLDGGICMKGLESTILHWNGIRWEIIRLGAISAEKFVPVLGYVPATKIFSKETEKPLCPGQMYRHYAPKAHLKFIENQDPYGYVIGFEDRVYPSGCNLLSLGNSSNPEIAAQRLYALLRYLDQENISEAWVDANVPQEGLWLTLLERLHKASQP